jgi:hypothetical protein
MRAAWRKDALSPFHVGKIKRKSTLDNVVCLCVCARARVSVCVFVCVFVCAYA